MYKLMAQNTCSLRNAVSELCEFAKKKTPAIALFSLSEVATYFLYPAEEDHIDFTIVPIDNRMTWVIGLTSAFLVGHLLCVIENNITNVILPPTFGLDAEAWDFNWVPHPVWGTVWANYHLVDPDSEGDDNFTHMVSVAPSNIFRTDPGDQV